jgi:hypothetical protein
MTVAPKARCVDMAACEERRIGNTKRVYTDKPSLVMLRTKGRAYFLKAVPDFDSEKKHIGEHLELVAEPKEGTVFPAQRATHLALAWGAVTVERR